MSTEQQVVSALIHHQLQGGSRGFCIPRYTPCGWWECDLAYVTAAQYLVEYEVKLTRQDFLADAKKVQGGSRYRRRLQTLERYLQDEQSEDRRQSLQQQIQRTKDQMVTKHQRLAAGCPSGPSRFWYVIPDGMLELEDIPEWAGVITVTNPKLQLQPDTPESHQRQLLATHHWSYLHTQQVRQPRQLHRKKLPQTVLDHMRGVCYWRMLTYYTAGGRVEPVVEILK